MADTSQVRLASIAEVTEGTTPSSPAFDVMRFTSDSLKPGIENISSNEIRADRNIPDLTQVGQSAAGAVNFELSYGTFDAWLEGLMHSAWATDVLKNGVTPKSFTLEKKIEAGATDQYHRYVGSRPNTLSLAIRAKAPVTGSFGFLCRSFSTGQAILSSATYNAANSNPIMNAASNFASLSMTGVTSPQIVGLSLNISNNLRQQPIVGQLASKGIGTGRFMVTGEIDAYFETNDQLDLFLAATASDLSFTIGGASDLNYNFSMGTIKFTDWDAPTSGADQDLMAKIGFQAIYDSGDAASLVITRTPAS